MEAVPVVKDMEAVQRSEQLSDGFAELPNSAVRKW